MLSDNWTALIVQDSHRPSGVVERGEASLVDAFLRARLSWQPQTKVAVAPDFANAAA